MRDDIKSKLDSMDIPEPRAGFEDRIIAAAKKNKATAAPNVVSFTVKKRSFVSRVGFVSALAACVALLWVVPTTVSFVGDIDISSLPVLMDISFIAEPELFDISEEDLLAGVLL